MMGKILFVDDEPRILDSIWRNLHRQFKISTATSGEEALKKLMKEGPYEVIVSDMRMPGMDGTRFLSEAHKLAPDTVRILLTGQADMNDAVAVVNQGQIFRFLTKPCSPPTLANAIQAGIRQYQLVTAEKDLLEKTLHGSIKLLTEILSIVNPEAFSLSIRLKRITHNLASRLNIAILWEVDLAAMLSQIGVVTLPQELLNKKRSDRPLNTEETTFLNKHLLVGRKLLKNIPRLEKVAEAIYYQEKCYDGEGFPKDSVKGKDIPLVARILKVAKDYLRLKDRNYNPVQALEFMKKQHLRYDPEVLAALEAEILNAESGFIVKEISAERIEVGMVLADDVRTRSGALLIPKRHEISEIVKLRILHFAEAKNLTEPLKVLDIVTEQENVQDYLAI